MDTHVIGLLHPGEMGGAIGRCLASRGHTVLWASEARSPATRTRAKAAGLNDAGTVSALAGQAGIILSVCPPHAAADVAWAVHGFRGLYVDANAISPGTAREVAQMITDSGGRYVDGGIIGPPPTAPGSTRLYLSGPDAETVQALFAGSDLDARITGPSLTAASAVKVSYAAWTKGTAALILAIRELAREEGVEEILLAEWALSQPKLEKRSQGSAQAATAKGWRWVAEMEEIASAFSSSGLPDGFHLAAAEIFRRYPRHDSDSQDGGGYGRQAFSRPPAARSVPGQPAGRIPDPAIPADQSDPGQSFG